MFLRARVELETVITIRQMEEEGPHGSVTIKGIISLSMSQSSTDQRCACLDLPHYPQLWRQMDLVSIGEKPESTLI